jgi:predicted MPP superfamily phosphohydrolase
MKRRWLGRIVMALIVVGLFLASWAFLWEPSRITHRTYRLEIPRWPAECADLRVAVAGDLHVGSPHYGIDKLRRVVREVLALKPDLILLAGDYVVQDVPGGHFVRPEDFGPELAKLHPGPPVYSVLGNHDWWLDGLRVRRALEAAGIPVIDNSARRVTIRGCSFWLVGISDYWAGKPDVPKALRGLPQGAPALALTHNPDLFPELPDRFSLVIAAHTHDGQVVVPFIGRPIVPSKYGERYALGHIVENGRHLFVTTGLGTSVFPVRFRVPPELSILELRGSVGSLAR